MGARHPLPFITVLIPCRNERRFIACCLNSIVNNGYPTDRLTVLVVDGMSDDGTREVLDAYARDHSCVRVIDNPGRTTPKALNLGLREAQGEAVLRVDAHACLEPGYIQACANALNEYGADVVCGLMRTVPSSASPIGEAIAAALSHPFGVGNSYFRIHVSSPTWVDTVFCGCYRREVFARVPASQQIVDNEAEEAGDNAADGRGPFNAALIRGQDMDFSLRLRKIGGRMLLLPDIRSEYYARSTLRSFWKQNWNNGVWAILPFAYSEGMPISLRHVIPLGFVSSFLSTAVGGLTLPPLLWLSGGILGAYGMVNLAASLHAAWLERSLNRMVLMPCVFATLHLAYGLGSLWGLARLSGLPQFWRKLAVRKSPRPSAVVSSRSSVRSEKGCDEAPV